MADNSILPATGDVIAADEIGGIKFQRVKVVWGPDGTATETNTGAGFPVAVQGTVPVSGTFWQATQPISGTVGVSGSVAVTGTFFQATQPVSLASVPSHAVTNAGTFAVQAAVADGSDVATGAKADATWDGSAAASGISLWRYIGTKIEAVRALLAGTLTVGTHAVTQSGTWTVQPGNTANTTAWKVDGSAVTQPVSGTFWQATQPVSNAGTFATQAAQSGTWTVGLSASQTLATVTTVSTVTNLSQLGGAAIAMNTGVRTAGTQRVTIATDDLVPANVSQINGVTPLMGNGATGTGALRVSIANDSTGIVALPAAGTSIVGTKAAGTAGATSALTGAVYNSTTPALTDGQQVALQADTSGAQRVNTEGGKATYSTNATFAPASSAQDVWEIKGSGTKTVRITQISIYGQATTAAAIDTIIYKRSTANTGGTAATATAVPHDSNSSAATAVVKNYTANPTLGTLVGTVRRRMIPFGTSAAPVSTTVLEFTTRNSQGIVLRGTNESIVINLIFATIAGGFMWVDVEWTEE